MRKSENIFPTDSSQTLRLLPSRHAQSQEQLLHQIDGGGWRRFDLNEG